MGSGGRVARSDVARSPDGFKPRLQDRLPATGGGTSSGGDGTDPINTARGTPGDRRFVVTDLMHFSQHRAWGRGQAESPAFRAPLFSSRAGMSDLKDGRPRVGTTTGAAELCLLIPPLKRGGSARSAGVGSESK